jgi:hypothetical protein
VFIHIKKLSFVFFLSVSSIVFAQQPPSPPNTLPKRIQAVYEVTKNGQPFAKVHEQFVVTEHTYKIESVTKGIGVYALFGERQLTSIGEVTEQGLKPTRFDLQQGDNAKKSLSADFDWVKQNLTMTVKGKVKEAVLTQSTQDLASYAYQFMFLPAPLKDAVTVTLTTGKKLNQYQYKINPEFEVINSAGVQYKTLHLVQSVQNKPETKELWLAAEHYYVPVRILMVDDNEQKLEQTLIELHVE